MSRWIWAALCVTSTLWLVSEGSPGWVIALNVALDLDAIVRAVRGPR